MENPNPEGRDNDKPKTQSEKQERMMRFIQNKFGSSLNLHDPKLTAILSSLKTPTHPPYALMINRAISELDDGDGSSVKVISEFIKKGYDNLPLAHDPILRHHLSNLCERRELICTDDGMYILPSDCAVEKDATAVPERKKRKRARHEGAGVRRLSKAMSRGGEETNGGDIGEGNPPRGEVEVEVEGIRDEEQGDSVGKHGKGKETSFEAIADRSKTERQIERTSMESDDGVQLNDTECFTSQNLDQELSEVVVGEQQLQLEEVQKQPQHDATESNKTMPALPQTATEQLADPSHEVDRHVQPTKPEKPSLVQKQKLHDRSEIQRRKLRSHIEPEMPIIISEPLLLSEFVELQVKGSSSLDAELQLINQRRNDITTKVSAPSDFELREPNEKQNVQREKELSLPHQFARRFLRSHAEAPSVSALPVPTPSLSVLSEQPPKRKLKPVVHTAKAVCKLSLNSVSSSSLRVKQRGRGGPRKVNIEANADAESALSLASQPPKGMDRGRPRKLNMEANSKASSLNADSSLSLALQPMTHSGRGRPRKQTREANSNNNDESALSLPEPVKRGRGRPRKMDTELSSNADAALALASGQVKGDDQDTRRKPNHTEDNPNAEAAMASPPHLCTGDGRGGRLMEDESNADTTAASGIVAETNKKQQPRAEKSSVSEPRGGERVTRSRLQQSNALGNALVEGLK